MNIADGTAVVDCEGNPAFISLWQGGEPNGSGLCTYLETTDATGWKDYNCDTGATDLALCMLKGGGTQLG